MLLGTTIDNACMFFCQSVSRQYTCKTRLQVKYMSLNTNTTPCDLTTLTKAKYISNAQDLMLNNYLGEHLDILHTSVEVVLDKGVQEQCLIAHNTRILFIYLFQAYHFTYAPFFSGIKRSLPSEIAKNLDLIDQCNGILEVIVHF